MPPGAGADAGDGVLHGVDDLGILAHAEIVIAAPDGNLLHLIAAIVIGQGELSGLAFKVGEDAIAALGLKAAQGFGEELLVIHEVQFKLRASDAET